ncbi:MAG: amidohydrolase family protein [Chloroflexota bacterium]
MVPLTNAHTHLELTDLADLCPVEPVDFVIWLARLAWRLRQRSETQIRAAIDRGLAELEAAGVTHVGDITHSWLSVAPLLASGLHGVVYLEVLGQPRGRALARLAEAQAAIRQARRRPEYGPMQVGLSLHAPYSCHPDLLRAGAAWCRTEDVPLCIHVAESPAETELLLTGRVSTLGRPLTWLARNLRLLPATTPGLRPVPYLAGLGVLAARPLLVHAVHVAAADIALLAETSCSVVHCPRSNQRLSCGRMPLERYLAAGVPVYLGTDSRASSPDLDSRAEAAFAVRLHAGLVEREQIEALVHQKFPPNLERR